MQVGPFWCITVGTLIGPWHVSSLMPALTPGGKKHRAGSWYIVNKDTGDSRRVGPVKARGKNWHDAAITEAKRRNEQHLRSLDPKELPLMLGQNDLLDAAISRILKEESLV